jgi:hypothetical protein
MGVVTMLFPDDRDDRILLEQVRLGKIAKQRERLAQISVSLLTKKDRIKTPKGVALVQDSYMSKLRYK